MSTTPSEHAMVATATISIHIILGMSHMTKEGRDEIMSIIDTHAIAPAVEEATREKDAQIAEYEAVLKAFAEGCSFPEDDVQRAIRDRSRAVLAKHERSAT